MVYPDFVQSAAKILFAKYNPVWHRFIKLQNYNFILKYATRHYHKMVVFYSNE
jgi:hypothetical protein